MSSPAPASTSNAAPFLTDEQRVALDAALAIKAQEKKIAKLQQGGGSNDRKSRNGKGTGQAKKGGGGGKFTWGDPLDPSSSASHIDKNDPNYDSDDDEVMDQHTQQELLKIEANSFKAEAQRLVEEYFNSADISNVSSSLEDLSAPQYTHLFVKRLVTIAMDKHDREREMASVLLSSLYAEAIPADSMAKGFKVLVDSLEDLSLDVPDAVEMMTNFIARAIVDDILPPSFIHKINGPEGSKAHALRHALETHMGARHSAEKILRCWGGNGAGMSYQSAKDAVTSLLNEFLVSADEQEVRRALRTLAMPFFHHEFVKIAIHEALDNATHMAPVTKLLHSLTESGDISLSQLHKGLARVAANLPDTSIDNPDAPARYQELVDALQKAGVSMTDGKANFTEVHTPAPHPPTVAQFKAACLDMLKEYFLSGDIAEVGRALEELDEPGLHHVFVKAALHLAFDRHDREREMVSELLSDLSPKVIAADQLQLGFKRCLEQIDDTVLDIPDAVHLLSFFIGRAIVDEILPPSYLAHVLPSVSHDSMAVQVIKHAGVLLSARHGAERLVECWHGGALTVDQVREQMLALLYEYFVSKDGKEAARCLYELDVPHYHHEVVAEGIEMVMDGKGSQEDAVALFKSMADSGQISATQMAMGFTRIQECLDDLVLDYPHARETYSHLVEAGTKQGWLSLEPAV